MLGGSTLARTPHFALHSVGLGSRQDLPEAKAAPVRAPQPLFAQCVVWIGAQVPKRWAKRAVTRNTIKRQIYSVCSEYESRLVSAAHVVRLRSGFDRAHFVSATSDHLRQAVREELQQLFDRATSHSTNPANAANAGRAL